MSSRPNYRIDPLERIRLRTKERCAQAARVTCSWCGADIGPAPENLQPPGGESHGICPECAEKLLREYDETLPERARQAGAV